MTVGQVLGTIHIQSCILTRLLAPIFTVQTLRKQVIRVWLLMKGSCKAFRSQIIWWLAYRQPIISTCTPRRRCSPCCGRRWRGGGGGGAPGGFADVYRTAAQFKSRLTGRRVLEQLGLILPQPAQGAAADPATPPARRTAATFPGTDCCLHYLSFNSVRHERMLLQSCHCYNIIKVKVAYG